MPAMSRAEEAVNQEVCDFKWGKKRGRGGKKKEVQFYESFTYDRVEYSLYDCVYLLPEDETEPYIGKLIKMWEQPKNEKNKQPKIEKRVKILWFFRPMEIQNWLGDVLPLENELFLASGEGVGLANVNDLEAIAGKCNVVCISKDPRNPRPSEEELSMADYVFYRTFDVGKCTISHNIDDKVAGIEVMFIFNQKEFKKTSGIPEPDVDSKEEKARVLAINEAPRSLETSPGERSISGIGVEMRNTATALDKQGPVYVKNRPKPASDSEKVDDKSGKIPTSKVEEKGKLKSAKDSDTSDDRPAKKARLDSSVKSSEELQPNISSSSALEKDKSGNVVHKLRRDSNEDDMKAAVTNGRGSEDKRKSKPVEDSHGHEKVVRKKVKPDEKESRLSNGTLPKAAATHTREKDIKTDVQDRSKWFKGLPWEERMQTAHEQGTLVLLSNLYPGYSSADVEEIVWEGFREKCSAKMVQRTATSSPHCGQAFVIFRTREAAETAMRKLDEGCFLLPNGSPLVGSRVTPLMPGTPCTFYGHIFIEKLRPQMQREEMKRAVSTSHYSQPNTIEYDMAMEWRLLQARSENWWKALYKRHGDELKKLKGNLKSK
ncbi:protein ANTI-SILENCING 1 isoform X2 [Macadamia integrifolia]|uniref:protein ANTI-SILENCING 1 isoform X2 n=1 Tax=Macadamia integrifolia TaxID=60698 RepID=UPI001C5326F0|nr:protein ANTI-SILENCING 1 isoform X2 [Macadamia integrifolia]